MGGGRLEGGAPGSRRAPWVQAMERGHGLDARGRHDKAIECYREALALGGSRADLYAEIGQSLRVMGRTEEAIEHLDRAIESDPRHPVALFKKAEALVALNRVDEARGYCGRAIESDPGMAEAHHTMGIIHFRQPDYEASIAEYAESIRLNPDNFRGYANMGTGHMALGRLDEALQCFDAALRIDPKYAFAHCQRSVVLGRLGREDESRESYERAVEHDPRYMLGDARVHLRADRQAELSRAGWRDGRPPRGLGKVRVPTGRSRARSEAGRERDLTLGRLAAACELEGVSLMDTIAAMLGGDQPAGLPPVHDGAREAGPAGGRARPSGAGKKRERKGRGAPT